MPTVSDVMSTEVQVIEAGATLREAAELMRDLDIGSLPVCQGRLLLGMVTDRDITVRGIAAGLTPDATPVSEVMSKDLEFCTIDQDTAEVMHTMGRAQVRRLPVIDIERQLVGIVSLGDLALRQPGHIDETMRQIAEPSTAIPETGQA